MLNLTRRFLLAAAFEQRGWRYATGMAHRIVAVMRLSNAPLLDMERLAQAVGGGWATPFPPGGAPPNRRRAPTTLVHAPRGTLG